MQVEYHLSLAPIACVNSRLLHLFICGLEFTVTYRKALVFVSKRSIFDAELKQIS